MGQRDEDALLQTEISMDLPSPARMYDFFLGGSHNFAADRRAAREVMAIYPDVELVARANRAFLRRAVRYLLDQGIDQFLDIGSGIPTAGNVHEVAHQRNPEARVVYVDSDPVAVQHSRMVLENILSATVIQADARLPERILSHPEVLRLLDFDRPVAVLLLTLLAFVMDDTDAYELVHTLRDALAPGSYLAISHGTAEDVPGESMAQIERLYARSTNPATSRSRQEIAPFFDGFALVDPGLVHAPSWHPDGPYDPFRQEPSRSAVLVSVGRKPG